MTTHYLTKMDPFGGGMPVDKEIGKEKADEYATGQPFPHVVIDDFLPENLARMAEGQFFLEGFREFQDLFWRSWLTAQNVVPFLHCIALDGLHIHYLATVIHKNGRYLRNRDSRLLPIARDIPVEAAQVLPLPRRFESTEALASK